MSEYVTDDTRCPHRRSSRCVFEANHYGDCLFQNSREAVELAQVWLEATKQRKGAA